MGYVCILMADSRCMAETNTTLQSNYPPTKNQLKKDISIHKKILKKLQNLSNMVPPIFFLPLQIKQAKRSVLACAPTPQSYKGGVQMRLRRPVTGLPFLVFSPPFPGSWTNSYLLQPDFSPISSTHRGS